MNRQTKKSLFSGRPVGFTLIELLVVIAIIGLLIAILIPGLMMAQEAANELICKTNQDQVYKASFVFVEDNDENRLPYLGFAEYRWVPQVANAIGHLEPAMYSCPSDTNQGTHVTLQRGGSSFFIRNDKPANIPASEVKTLSIPVTYRGFCDQADESAPPGSYLGRKSTDFKNPSNEMMLVEGWVKAEQTSCQRIHRLYELSHTNASDAYKFFYTWERHSGTTNVLFIDGHVDRMIPREIGELAVGQEFGGIPPEFQ